MTISGMDDGESCTYKIKSSKGSPCFKVSNESNIDDRKINITYVEFEENKVNKSSDSGQGRDKSPSDGMPARNQSFEDSGEQGNSTKGGQKKPSRKTKDGNMTTDENLDDEKEYKKKKDKYKEEKEEEE